MAIIVHFGYNGVFSKYAGLPIRIVIRPSDGSYIPSEISDVLVMPSLTSGYPLIPGHLRPEITSLILEAWGVKKEPVYVNPRLN